MPWTATRQRLEVQASFVLHAGDAARSAWACGDLSLRTGSNYSTLWSAQLQMRSVQLGIGLQLQKQRLACRLTTSNMK